MLDERVAMGGLAAQRLEDHHFQRAGKEIARWGIFLYRNRHSNGREYVAFCTRAGEALDNLPVNPNQVVQAVGNTEHQGY
jgi:hypothetical protein